MSKTYTEKRFKDYYEDEVSVTLRASFGSYGGGSEVFVVTRLMPFVQETTRESETNSSQKES